MKYLVTVPPTHEQGSYKTVVKSSGHETYRARALWDYNSARAHDGLEPVSRMPAGTVYLPIKTALSQIDAAKGLRAKVLTNALALLDL